MEAETDAVRAALEEPTRVLRADGADLVLVDVEPALDRVTLRLELEGASCADCVLPPGQLRETITATLQRELRTELEIRLHDPRTESAGGGAAS